MSYGRISNSQKEILLTVSVLIHLMIMVVFGLSPQKTAKKSLTNQFDLYAIKLLDLKPMSKDRLSSKGDTKSGEMTRKKRNNKTFPQKGVRQALAPKTPLESLKKIASNPLRENKNISLPKFNVRQRPTNRLEKTTAMASVDHLKRQIEWKQKLVFNRPEVSTKLEGSLQLKSYIKKPKLVSKKQITPLKSTNIQYAKTQPQQSVDQLRRTQRFTPSNRSSLTKMKLYQPQTMPQVDRNIQLAKLVPNEHQGRINNYINYQQKQLISKPVVINQRQASYITPVVRKTTVSPNQFLTEVTQTITEVKQVEVITRVVRMTTSVSRVDSIPLLTSDFSPEFTPAEAMQKQAKIAAATPQKVVAAKQTISYQQRQNQEKPVELTRQRGSYQQLQMVNREVAGPATPAQPQVAQPQVAQPQSLGALSRQSTSLEHTPRVNKAVFTNDLALEPIPAKIMQKQAKIAAATPQKVAAAKQTISYQQRQNQKKQVEMTRQRGSYQQLQMANREVAGPATLDVAAPAQPQLAQPQMAQPQSLGALSRQSTILRAETATPILSPKSMLEEVPQREFTDKQVQMAKLESSTEEFAAKKRLEFGQRSLVKPTRITQQRVAYQQASQKVDRNFLDQPTSRINSVPQMEEPAGLLASETQLATISRQELTPHNSTSSDNFTLETQHYAPQQEMAVDYTKHQSAPQVIEQERRLAFAYTGETKDKSKVRLDTSHLSGGVSANQMHGSPTSPLLSRGQATSGEKNAPVIELKLPSGNMTRETLYRLTGEIGGRVKQAFVTINEITQLVQVANGKFEVEIAMVKGMNKISILAFDSHGGVGKEEVELLYNPPPGVPFVTLGSPQNGKQGVKEGDPIIVSGNIDDHSITRAILYLNGIPIKMKVVNGRFQKKVFLPNTRITTFRIMARHRDGLPGYSAMHTILSGYDIDIINPRPY